MASLRHRASGPFGHLAAVIGCLFWVGGLAAGTAADEFAWYGWGDNENGQLGQREEIVALHQADGWGSAAQVSAGAYHSLAVGQDGSLWACGSNGSGRLGDGTSTDRRTPVQVLSGGVAAVAAGAAHSLILKADGSLWACGSNAYGQLGDGATADQQRPVQVLPGGVAAVAAGANHTLILKADGSVWACGRNDYGQLGNGTTTDCNAPVQVFAGGVAGVAAGANHSLAVTSDGSLWAWGNNDYGQIGDDSTTDRRAPVKVLDAGVAMAAAGGGHSLVVKTDDTLWACGNNSSGQLGDNTRYSRSVYTQCPATEVQAVAAGMNHTLILKVDGSLWACGENSDGQLGNGSATDRLTPVRIVRRDVLRVSAGGLHSLVVKSDDSVWVCGSNAYGQRGDGSSPNLAAPSRLLVNGVAAAAAGGLHSLVVGTDGSVWACGDNGVGQLGDGTTTQRETLTQVGMTGVASVSAGAAHSLFVKGNGALLACGRNASGQLGTGNRVDRLVPVPVFSSGVAAVSAGGAHSLILNRNGSLWGCGENGSGQLGTGGAGDSIVPVRILASGVAAMAAGGAHTLIVKEDGSLWACGENSYGQLGDGTTTDRLRPVQVLAGGVASVSAGASHSLIVMTDGSLWACGRNASGQLGDGTTTDRPTPVQVLASGVSSASAGGGHSLIAMADGSLWACGLNASGQVGDGSDSDRPVPVPVLVADVAAVAAGGSHSLALATPSYTLTYLSDDEGTIEGAATQTVTHGGAGTAVTAVPGTGYHFVRWSDNSTANPRTDTDVRSDITVVAYFGLNEYTLAYAPGPNGHLTGAVLQLVGHGSDGTAVTAVPEAGYHFVQWSDGSAANPRTDLGVTGGLSVTASFAAGLYTLIYLAEPGGSLVGPSPQAVAHGESGAAVTAVPDAGSHFVQWSDGLAVNPRTDSSVAADVTVSAWFAAGPYTLTYLAGLHGSVTGTTTQAVIHGQDGTLVTAVPANNYHFVQWSDGSTANPRADLAVMTDIAVTAQFAIDTRTVTFLAGLHGTISGAATQSVAVGGYTSLVTAVPDPGYLFTRWSDDSTDNTDNPRRLWNVREDTTLTALFSAASATTPNGTFHAVVGAEDVMAGRGWWHLAGSGYTAEVAGNPLTLTLVHDSRGGLSGTGTYTVSGAEDLAATLAVKGKVKGNGGGAVASFSLKGADAAKRVVVSLALRLAVDPASGVLTGPVKGTVKVNGVTTPVQETLSMALPAGVDGTWTLALQLTVAGTAVTGTAALTFGNGADYAFTVRGQSSGSTAALSFTRAATDPDASGFRIAATVLTLDGNWAMFETFSGKGCGQVLAW